MRLNSYIISVIVTAFVAPALCGCVVEDGPVQDYTFEYDENQMHCIYEGWNDNLSSALCLRSGAYRAHAPTWSTLDLAYELTEDTTVLSSGWIWDATEYIHVEFFGQKTGDATLEVVFDYLEDDFRTETEPLTPAPYDAFERNANARKRISVNIGDWADFSFSPTPPDWADAVAVHLVKKGKGTVSLARLVLDFSSDRNRNLKGFENMDLECAADDECGKKLVCAEVPHSTEGDAVCTLCNRDEQCDADTVCGVSLLGDTRECVFSGIKSLGDFCAESEECMEGVCCEGRCSACCEDAPCDGDGTCAQINGDAPHQCDPGEGAFAKGDACFRDADCASAHCEGHASQSDDTANCEDAGVQSDAGTNDACPATRIRYGTCMEPSEAD